MQFVAGPDQGEIAAYVNIKNYGGLFERDRLISPKLNFYAHKDIVLEFQYAYRQRTSAYTDSLIVFISDDCGENWTRLLAMAEDPEPERVFATSEPSADEFIPEVGSDWCGSENNPECVSIDLSGYAGKSDISIMFESFNSYGNNMFIDNIVIDGTIIGTGETVVEGDRIILYPNPSSGVITATFPDAREYCLTSVYTMAGTLVFTKTIHNPVVEQLDFSGLPAGIYLVELKTDAGRTLEKLIIQ